MEFLGGKAMDKNSKVMVTGPVYRGTCPFPPSLYARYQSMQIGKKKKCTQKYPAVSFAQVCSIGCNPNSLGIFDNRTSALPNNNLTPYSLFIPIFVHLCIYLFTYLFIRRFTRAPVHSIVHLLANQQFINLLIYLQTSCSFTCSFTNS